MKVTDEVYREYSQMVYKYLFFVDWGCACGGGSDSGDFLIKRSAVPGVLTEAAVSLPGFVLLRRIN